MTQSLVDRIYECAFAPEFWPETLDHLARIAGARGGSFLTSKFKGPVLRWAASPGLHDDVSSYVADDWLQRDPRTKRVTKAHHQGFLTDYDLSSEEEVEADTARREFYLPRGLGWRVDTAAPLPTGDWFIFTFPREFSSGPAEKSVIAELDALRPHLARSAFMSARLQLERARVASQTLALIGLPALVFDADGKVLAANALIENLTDHIRWRPHDRVALKDPRADEQLRGAYEHPQMLETAPVRSFVVRGPDAEAAMVGHIVPVRGRACDVFARCAGVLMLTPVTAPHSPPIELIRSLFDFTPSEARVARLIVAGQTVDEIAEAAGVSRNTVRTQLNGVMAKTNCRRQAEVVALLSGVALPVESEPSA